MSNSIPLLDEDAVTYRGPKLDVGVSDFYTNSIDSCAAGREYRRE